MNDSSNSIFITFVFHITIKPYISSKEIIMQDIVEVQDENKKLKEILSKMREYWYHVTNISYG